MLGNSWEYWEDNEEYWRNMGEYWGNMGNIGGKLQEHCRNIREQCRMFGEQWGTWGTMGNMGNNGEHGGQWGTFGETSRNVHFCFSMLLHIDVTWCDISHKQMMSSQEHQFLPIKTVNNRMFDFTLSF